MQNPTFKIIRGDLHRPEVTQNDPKLPIIPCMPKILSNFLSNFTSDCLMNYTIILTFV